MPRVNRYSLDVVRNAVLAPPSMELCQTASGTCAGTYYSVRGIRGISKSVGKTSATTTITIKEFPLEFGRDLASRQQGRDLLPQSALSPLQCRIRMTNRFAKRYTPYYFSLEFQENIALRRSDPGTFVPRNVVGPTPQRHPATSATPCISSASFAAYFRRPSTKSGFSDSLNLRHEGREVRSVLLHAYVRQFSRPPTG